ncbi:MAG: flagellar export protein FliJ [Gemmatimonadetes bacterium]|jgi:flagellar FliJ protein|nr:flagellar export protein FliJ [Gemmatimonadota bacterium]MBT4608741.1 flagellar export protein FliJ [Gemmatimonadota bacterium]MBT5058648.1 flagellar export protein FliJ [Gemmatimonadota bacterium]MBT5144085.1 flagellar export protein FliJ [Gemmatimonadota bacterium]MBT5586557.1 flagellar export protein FliJ [Gemmatimonadota bacterium]
MRQFQFRFQRVYELKERMEDVRKAALGDAVGALEAEREELRRLGDEKQLRRQASRGESGQTLEPGLLQLASNFGLRLERESGEQTEQVRLAQTVTDEKRAELMEATRDRKVFEILRDRAAAAHKKAAQRHELRILDEIGGQLHHRKDTEEPK